MSLTLLHPTATRFQVALNAALPACSLCINRRLYKIATTKAVVFTDAQRRRALICDLLICVGIPILQIFARECTCVSFVCRSFTGWNPEYIVSSNQYNIFEDFGPDSAMVNTPLTFVFFFGWPMMIGSVSLVYCGECLGFRPGVSYLTCHSHERFLLLQLRPSIEAVDVVYSSHS